MSERYGLIPFHSIAPQYRSMKEKQREKRDKNGTLSLSRNGTKVGVKGGVERGGGLGLTLAEHRGSRRSWFL